VHVHILHQIDAFDAIAIVGSPTDRVTERLIRLYYAYIGNNEEKIATHTHTHTHIYRRIQAWWDTAAANITVDEHTKSPTDHAKLIGITTLVWVKHATHLAIGRVDFMFRRLNTSK
jgi:hypothetical protein